MLHFGMPQSSLKKQANSRAIFSEAKDLVTLEVNETRKSKVIIWLQSDDV